MYCYHTIKCQLEKSVKCKEGTTRPTLFEALKSVARRNWILKKSTSSWSWGLLRWSMFWNSVYTIIVTSDDPTNFCQLQSQHIQPRVFVSCLFLFSVFTVRWQAHLVKTPPLPPQTRHRFLARPATIATPHPSSTWASPILEQLEKLFTLFFLKYACSSDFFLFPKKKNGGQPTLSALWKKLCARDFFVFKWLLPHKAYYVDKCYNNQTCAAYSNWKYIVVLICFSEKSYDVLSFMYAYEKRKFLNFFKLIPSLAIFNSWQVPRGKHEAWNGKEKNDVGLKLENIFWPELERGRRGIIWFSWGLSFQLA